MITEFLNALSEIKNASRVVAQGVRAHIAAVLRGQRRGQRRFAKTNAVLAREEHGAQVVLELSVLQLGGVVVKDPPGNIVTYDKTL